VSDELEDGGGHRSLVSTDMSEGGGETGSKDVGSGGQTKCKELGEEPIKIETGALLAW
jgi:hypothetical protein